MRRKQPELRFEEEAPKFEVGQAVPLILRYCLGVRPKLVAIDADFALQQFRNGARMEKLPLRDLVDDIGYW